MKSEVKGTATSKRLGNTGLTFTNSSHEDVEIENTRKFMFFKQ